MRCTTRNRIRPIMWWFTSPSRAFCLGMYDKSADSKNIGFTGDANINEWPLSVKSKERFPNAAVVIPHHGLWGGNEPYRSHFETSATTQAIAHTTTAYLVKQIKKNQLHT